MPQRTMDEISDIARRIRSGEIVDEALSTALIDVTDTVAALSVATENLQKMADEANAAARTAKEANAELYARISTSENTNENTTDEAEKKVVSYDDIFESEDEK